MTETRDLFIIFSVMLVLIILVSSLGGSLSSLSGSGLGGRGPSPPSSLQNMFMSNGQQGMYREGFDASVGTTTTPPVPAPAKMVPKMVPKMPLGDAADTPVDTSMAGTTKMAAKMIQSDGTIAKSTEMRNVEKFKGQGHPSKRVEFSQEHQSLEAFDSNSSMFASVTKIFNM